MRPIRRNCKSSARVPQVIPAASHEENSLTTTLEQPDAMFPRCLFFLLLPGSSWQLSCSKFTTAIIWALPETSALHLCPSESILSCVPLCTAHKPAESEIQSQTTRSRELRGVLICCLQCHW